MDKDNRDKNQEEGKKIETEVQWNEYEERLCSDFIKESQAAYQATGDPALGRLLVKRQGEYTVEDYFALPEDCRVELIDGVLYNMCAPTYKHQGLGGYIYAQFFNYVSRNKGKCLPFMSPCNVQLDCNDKTIVQPDVIIACDRDKFRGRVYYGAPELVIEVLSPSSGKRDREIKYRKYKNAGVREYWIVDPKAKRVTVYDFEHEEKITVYTFEDKVPVGIWDGKCEVDFAEAYEMIRFLYEQEE